METIITRNEDIGQNQEDFLRKFTPKFRTGRRDLDTTNWVVKVSPEVRNEVLRKKTLYIG